MRKFTILVAALFAVSAISFAGNTDISTTLGTVGSAYAQAYMQPFENAFGADLNSAFYHTADLGSNGFHLNVGIVGGGATVPSSDQTMGGFSYSGQYSPSSGGTYNATFTVRPGAPTVFGDENAKGEVVVTWKNNLGLAGVDSFQTISGLKSLSLAPLPIPQAEIGTIMGTDLTVRFLPTISLGNFGSLGLWGIGIRHSISQYLFPMGDAPFNLAVGIAFQGFHVNDTSGNTLLSNSTFAFNAEISKSFSILTIYGGLQTEKSSMDVNYTYHDSNTGASVPIAFTLDAANTFRGTIGACLDLYVFNIFADYSVGNTSIISGGLLIVL